MTIIDGKELAALVEETSKPLDGQRERLPAGVTRRIRVNTRYLTDATGGEKAWRVIEIRPDGSELCLYFDDVTIAGPSHGVASVELGTGGKVKPCAWIETTAALYVR